MRRRALDAAARSYSQRVGPTIRDRNKRMDTTTREPQTRSGSTGSNTQARVEKRLDESKMTELTDDVTAPSPEAPPSEPETREADPVAPEPVESRRPPVVVPDRGTTPDGYLRCPTPSDSDAERLLQQTIHTSDCVGRQRGGYHKCFDCQHCSLPAFDGTGLPPLENSPSHLSDARLAGLNPILY